MSPVLPGTPDAGIALGHGEGSPGGLLLSKDGIKADEVGEVSDMAWMSPAQFFGEVHPQCGGESAVRCGHPGPLVQELAPRWEALCDHAAGTNAEASQPKQPCSP